MLVYCIIYHIAALMYDFWCLCGMKCNKQFLFFIFFFCSRRKLLVQICYFIRYDCVCDTARWVILCVHSFCAVFMLCFPCATGCRFCSKLGALGISNIYMFAGNLCGTTIDVDTMAVVASSRIVVTRPARTHTHTAYAQSIASDNTNWTLLMKSVVIRRTEKINLLNQSISRRGYSNTANHFVHYKFNIEHVLRWRQLPIVCTRSQSTYWESYLLSVVCTKRYITHQLDHIYSCV